VAAGLALVTGFEPYGGRGMNPAAEVAARLDGLDIDRISVVGRTFPVSFAGLRGRITKLMQEVKPRIVVSVGLWPGDPTIRLERVAINVADFEIPDNEGAVLRDDVVEAGAPTAIAATLPLRAIESALLEAGIPVRLSSSAGTYLCNATLYTFLRAAESGGARCGFVHVPYFPQQVALLLAERKKDQQLELHQRTDLASMSLDTMVEAVRIVVAVSAATVA
jgi:pyroglutamyl-peptidase